MIDISKLGKTPDYVKKQELNIEKTGGSYIPSITVLTGMSPQINKQNEEKYVKGAEAGDLLISAPTPVLVKADDGIEFIPAVYREPYYVVWESDNAHKLDKMGNRKEGGSRKKRVGELTTLDSALIACDSEFKVPVKTIDYLIFTPKYMSKDDQKPIILRFDKPSRYRLADDFGEALSQEGSVSSVRWCLTSKYIKEVDNPYFTFDINAVDRPKADEYKAISTLAEEVKPAFLGQRKKPVTQISDVNSNVIM